MFAKRGPAYANNCNDLGTIVREDENGDRSFQTL